MDLFNMPDCVFIFLIIWKLGLVAVFSIYIKTYDEEPEWEKKNKKKAKTKPTWLDDLKGHLYGKNCSIIFISTQIIYC